MVYSYSQKKRWQLMGTMSEEAHELVRSLQIHPVVAQILIQRLIHDPQAVSDFLNPDLKKLPSPFLFKDMDKAVRRIEKAIHQKEKVTVYGDYDVDGTTGSSLLYLFFKELGFETNVYIPHRIQEGYGLNFKALESIREQGADLVITVDNGISSMAEAERARELGLDLIIIDHHQVPPQVPFAVAVLNPKQLDCPYPDKNLSGVGVAFQLTLALRHHLREKGFFEKRSEPNLKQHLDLVALGTIADVVPLTGVNRILVKEGLNELTHTQKIGIQALKEISAVKGPVTPGQVGFRLGPRINAVGRLDSAQLGFELLTTTDRTKAEALAKILNLANQERQVLEEKIIGEACAKVEREVLPRGRKSIFVFDKGWHLGVIGIVASRLVERYYLPAIVGMQEDDRIRCSARSIRDLNLYESLKLSERYLGKFGGHAAAAGLTLEISNYEPFWACFDEAVRSAVSEEDWTPSIRVDAQIEIQDIEESLVKALEVLAPFGQGNPEPVFWAKGFQGMGHQSIGNQHLKMGLKAGARVFESIGFGMAHGPLQFPAIVECVFSCQWNEWQGRKTLQLRLLDLPR